MRQGSPENALFDSKRPISVVLIGQGAIGSWLSEHLSPAPAIVRRGDPLPAADLVVEAAGHEALNDYGVAALRQGSDLVVASLGALADEELYEQLTNSGGKGQILLPAGALAGIDGLAAARYGGIDSVLYTSRKPPAALSDRLDPAKETLVFDGNAREAALRFPQNANVAAAVALAGLGFEKTSVLVIADPTVERNIHTIEASGSFGEMSIRIAGRPLPGNPKTSSLTAMSIMRCVLSRSSAIVI